MTNHDGTADDFAADGLEKSVDLEPTMTAMRSENQGKNKVKIRPTSILTLIEFAYSESGRKLNLVRKDFDGLSLEPADAADEVDAVRRLSPSDPLFAVPPRILAALGEFGAHPLVRGRILELVRVAFESHKLFGKRIGGTSNPQAVATQTARQISENAKKFTFDESGSRDNPELNKTDRDRLRANAVTAAELFRVLGDRWPVGQFIDDMSEFVWDTPKDSSPYKRAVILATAKNKDALSQLARHFEEKVDESRRETDNARSQARQQELRAVSAEAYGRRLSAELETARAVTAELGAEVSALTQRLSAEQNSRVVDQSHHVDDYETLRTQVIRRLTRQAELLGNGLHALRNGSATVAEEFVDRALSAIDGEVIRLKELEGEVL